MKESAQGWTLSQPANTYLGWWWKQNSLWVILATNPIASPLPKRAWSLLAFLQKESPLDLNPIIAWAVALLVGFTQDALSKESTTERQAHAQREQQEIMRARINPYSGGTTPKSNNAKRTTETPTREGAEGITPSIPDSAYTAGTPIGEPVEEWEKGGRPTPGGSAPLHASREKKGQVKKAPSGTGQRIRRGTSGFLGVDLYKRTGRWRARIRVGEKRIHLGYHDTALLASREYDRAALSAFGELAVVNDPALKAAWLESQQKGKTR